MDTSYAIALAAHTDQLHPKAMQIAAQMQTDRTRIVTTRAVLLEIGNALGKQRYRSTAVALLEALQEDPSVEIVPISDDIYSRAFDLYRSRPDKEWGLVDCISFIVMQERGIVGALTADVHFLQAGYSALLR